MECDDLREAVRAGYLVLQHRGLPEGVRMDTGVLRYDPEVDPSDRAPLVRRALAAVR